MILLYVVPVQNIDSLRNLVLSCHAGHRCQARNDRAWAGGRGTVGAQQGRVYFEVTVADEGLCRVGWAARHASLDLGTEPNSFGFGGTGAIYRQVRQMSVKSCIPMGCSGMGFTASMQGPLYVRQHVAENLQNESATTARPCLSQQSHSTAVTRHLKINPIPLQLQKTNRHFDPCWYDDYYNKSLKVLSLFMTNL